MKNKQINKSLIGRTGKDLINLLDSKSVRSSVRDIVVLSGIVETALLEIWRTLLGNKDFGVNSDFFIEGGNSLKAIQLVSRISKNFSVNLQLTDIFLNPTISQQATLIGLQQKAQASHSIIEAQHRVQHIPLSFSQERLWFIDRLEGSIPYHIPAVIRLKGTVNHEAINAAFQQIVNRHEVLRTIFIEDGSQLHQFITDKDNWSLSVKDVSSFNNNSEKLKRFVQKLIRVPFNLSADSMLRASFLIINSEESLLVVTVHHIAADAWSLNIFMKEFVEFYNAFTEKRQALLPQIDLQYADYTLWQKSQEHFSIKSMEYWQHKLHLVEPQNLPTDFVRPVYKNTDGASSVFYINKEQAAQVKKFCHQQGGCSMFMILLATFKVLLYRYSNQQDICVGTSIANRTRGELEGMIGFFVNTIVLRTKFDKDISFIDLLQKVKVTVLEAFEHQQVPFDKIVETVISERDINKSPLFQTMLVMPNTPDVDEMRLGDVEISAEDFSHNTSKYDITFFIAENKNGLRGTIEYNTSLFNEETIQRMAGHFKTLLNAVIKCPSQKIGLLPILTRAEEQQLHVNFNDSKISYPKDKHVINLFEEQVIKTPDAIALVFEEEKLSYRQLNQRANQLAHYLKGSGVKEESLVPVFMERGLQMMVGILAILKAGAAYVPVDVEFPAERISYILQDINAALLLCTAESHARLTIETGVHVIEVDAGMPEIELQPLHNPITSLAPANAAYVIYTSGSTGKPKGVIIEHFCLVDYVFGLSDKVPINQCKSFALVSTIATDLGNTVIYASLLSGGALHIFSKEATTNVETLHWYFNHHKIDCLKIVPSHWKALCMEDELLLPAKLLVFGGEVLRTETVKKIQAANANCTVVNHYGPTETTIGKLLHITLPGKIYGAAIPVGKPFSNTRVYVLNNVLQLNPIGIAGQLFIAGDGVARGYFNKPDITKEKFITDPFTKNNGALMYATGDLVKFLADGNIEFIGRVDDQVKIRGNRVELGEIEIIINQCGLVSQAVVIAGEDKQGNNRLIAYIVAEGAFKKDEITAYLKERLPEYMVPALLVQMQNLPLTANGKIDRKALPVPDAPETQNSGYAAPRNDAEKELTEIWQELLDVEQVGIHDNFFESGGDSIITIQLVSRARRAGYELQMADVFTYQTIARLSALLDQRTDTSATSGEQFLLEGTSGLLPIQQWYFEQGSPEVSYFNQSLLLTIDKGISEAILKRALEQLVAHHDTLRFKYYKKEGKWYQVYEHQNEVSRVSTENFQSSPAGALAALVIKHADRYQRSLDIEKGELVRVVLMQTPASETTNRLLVIVHHLAIDGVSWRILLEDLELLLNGLKNGGKTDLGNKTTSYRQWYQALEKYGQSKNITSQKNYWSKVVKNYKSLLVDKEYNEPVNLKGRLLHTIKIDAAQTRRLTHDVPRVYHTEINDILSAALAKTFTVYARTDKIVIGMEGHGREQIADDIDTSRTVGWFTTHYPVLLEVDKSKGEADLIKSIKEQLRQVPDKGLGFGVLKYINKEGAYQDKTCWDIVFNYLGQSDNILNAGNWLGIANELAGNDRSPEYKVNEKLTINAIIQSGELILHWNYSSKHFNEETILTIIQKFQANLQSLIAHCIDQQNLSGPLFTPSDYGVGKEISYSELDIFLNQLHKDGSRRASLQSLYRLSGLQQGMLFHGLYDGGSGIYMRQFNADLIGLDPKIFNETWSLILQQHDILRSGFYHEDFKIPVQCVYRTVNLPLEILDLSSMNGEEQFSAVIKYEEESRAEGFDFKSPPLMRIGLLRLSGGRYRMVWTWHHILFDGWSMAILMETFLKKYQLLSNGKLILQEAEDHYEDYIQYIDRGDKEKEEVYWRNYMQGVEHSTRLPFINALSERNKGTGVYKVAGLTLDAASSAQIQNFARGKHITVNTLMQAVWCYILHNYTGKKHVSFGVIVSGRPDDMKGVEKRVGLYINTLPLHAQMQEEIKIEDWLVSLQNEQVLSRQFQYTPLQDIQNFTGVAGNLFDTIMVFENYPVSKLLSSGKNKIGFENVVIHEHNNYALTITINNAEQVGISFNYNSSLLEEECIKMISGHFEHVMLQVINNAGGLVKDIQLITKAEEHQLLTAFNDNSTAYPTDKSIIDVFKEQVAKTPAATAIICEGDKISYQELNNRSTQLANYLIMLGIKAGGFVPLYIERSVEMMIGILGILKSGAAYVPIDPACPLERIRYMLSDIDCSVIITGNTYKNIFEDGKIETKILCLDEPYYLSMCSSAVDELVKILPSDLAYVIYTSGSTGKPKGVMVTHGNVVSLVKEVDYVSFKKEDVLLSTGSPSFDATTFEYWGMLLNGGQLVLCTEHKLLDIGLLKNEIEKWKVNKMWFTAGWFNRIVDTDISVFNGLETVMAGGEKLSEPHVQKLRNTYPVVEILNGYGPTENTTFSLIYKFIGTQVQSPIPIGRPLNNRKAYILDERYNLVPISVTGEIFVGGAGLSKGYLNRAELTADKFIISPFDKLKEERLYKTGDRGRWLPDGNIEYLGRIDQQVKIRGFRIELGEIETVLLQYEMVSQAVVIMKEDLEGAKKLVAYVVMTTGFDKSAIMSFLKERLPDYMLPAVWVQMENLPLTRNGKIDKHALPDPEITEISGEKHLAPRNEIEVLLAGIWQDLLGLEQVSVEDNFFEMGGDSIITIQLVSRVKQAGYQLQVADVFAHETIAGLAAIIEQRMGTYATTSAQQFILTGLVDLLPIQQWYFEKEPPAISHFNQSVLLCINKTVSVAVLQQAVENLMSHHDALRFKYYLKDGRWIQEYGGYKGAVITEDLRSATASSASILITERADNYQRSLDILKGELLRVVWMQTPAEEIDNRLLIVIHHLAVDGVSWRILLEDLERLISGLSNNYTTDLESKTNSYGEWRTALGNYSNSSKLLSQLPYWINAVKKHKDLPGEKLFTGTVKIGNKQKLAIKLSEGETRRLLQQVPKAYHTDINDILLAALAKTLCGWADCNTIIIGLEGHGRENIEAGTDIVRTVGWFTSLYPLLLEILSGGNDTDIIKTVKEQLRAVPDKGLGYGVLKYINNEEILQGPAPWDIVFNYLGQLDNIVKENKWLKPAAEYLGASVSEEMAVDEKISINSFVQGGELVVNWSYSNRHFEEITIKKIADEYLLNLQKLIVHCAEQNASGIQVFTPSDFGLGGEVSYQELDEFLTGPFANGKSKGELIESVYPLSGLQQGMLFHKLYDHAAGAYVVQFSCDLIDIDLNFFEQSWNYVIKKHTVLRSGFYHDELNIPVQAVYKEVQLPVKILDFRGLDQTEQEEKIKDYQHHDRNKGFDFTSVPLMRIGLMQTGESHYKMLWTSHHILFDGWSLPVLIEEFLTIYQVLAENKEVQIGTVDRYEDYIRYLEGRNKEDEKLYWQKYLHAITNGSLLPFIETTAERNKGVGEYHSELLELDAVITNKVNRFAQAQHITVNTIIQGVWALLLHEYTDSKNVVYGVVVSGRPDDLPNVERRVGMFINTVPLVSSIDDSPEINYWLKRIQEQQVSSRNHQYTPLHTIKYWREIHGDFFDSIVIFENYPVSKVIRDREWKLNVQNFQTTEQTNYPLSIIANTGDEISVRFSYNSELLQTQYVQAIRGHFENVLLQVIQDETQYIGGINLLTAAEQNQLLFAFNDTKVARREDKNIIELFEEQVANNPAGIAVVFDDRQLTYQQLNERSNQLAHLLISKGIGKETLIPVCVERSPEMMVTILGILKAGAAYVPVDPLYPQERINYILKDTGAGLIITNAASYINANLPGNIEILKLNSDWDIINLQPIHNAAVQIKLHQLAYIIYTSGSTGIPKGVMVEHGNLVSYLKNNKTNYIGLTKNNSGSFIHLSYTFDASLTAMFMPLLYGKRVVIGSKQSVEIFEDKNLLKYAPYDFIKITPAHLELLQPEFIKYNNGLLAERLIIGGEALHAAQFDSFIAAGINVEIVNEYGPTEATVGCTTFNFSTLADKGKIAKGISIGKPIDNTIIYVVGENDQLVPRGVKGEICIGGRGVARGYLNQPGLTDSKFSQDTFGKTGGRIYRTGDIGCWLLDGNIEYFGRADDQVKIRGFRIELGEIETVLMQSGLVNNAVILAKEDILANKKLVGYIVPNGVFDKDAITSWLLGKLPEYMVPQIWIPMENLPITSNGKINRKSLPDPDTIKLNKYIAPGNSIELAMAEIWGKVLGKNSVGIEDNFFELGGDSILTIQIVSRARRMGYQLQPKDIFKHQTISRLSKAIAERLVVVSTGEQGILTGLSGLLPIQQWYLETEQPFRSHFNQSVMLAIEKDITVTELNQVLRILGERHDALRFKYYQQDVSWKQEYGSCTCELISEDIQSVKTGVLAAAITGISEKYQQSLDIEKGELVKMVWMQTPSSETGNRLLMIVHHLAIDGVSWRILLEDLELLLSEIKTNKKESASLKSSSYRQWYQALENYGRSKSLLAQLSYWQQAVKGYQVMPFDKNYNGLIKLKDMEEYEASLSSDQTIFLLHDLPRVYHTEINDILLAALARSVSLWVDKEVITIGLEGHGREDIDPSIDTSRTIGWFTSLYPVALTVQKIMGEDDLIKSVKEQLRQVPDKGLGYGVLKYINKEPLLQNIDPWDILFNYLGQLDNVINESEWFSAAAEPTGRARSAEHFISDKIIINALVQDGSLLVNWRYCTLHFNENTIRRLADEYIGNLQKLIVHCIKKEKSGLVYTPSDFGLGSDISYEELDKFLEEDDSDNVISF